MTKRVLCVAAGCLVLIMGLIILHTPITMFVGMLVPSVAVVIKGWKEVVLIIAAVCCIVVLARDRQLRTVLMHDWLIWLSAAFVGIHLALSLYNFHGWHAYFAGLANDARYVIVLVVALMVATKVSWARTVIVRIVVAGALLVGVFGVLQLTVLPHDVLKYAGYDWQPGKVAPYLTVDNDPSFLRISSTLRGPNPLGFYAATIFTISSAWLVKRRKEGFDRKNVIAGVLAGLMAICLWFSYSRGALIAGLVGLALVATLAVWKRHKGMILTVVSLSLISLLLVTTVFRHNQFVATVVFHDSPTSGAQDTSNEGHISSLENGLASMLRQPLGSGIGSTGSASYYANDTGTLYIENQYLFIAHESGWIGIALFITLFVVLLSRLWALRDDYLATGVFAAGIGLATTSLVLPVWSDDAIAYLWWGLAGLAVASGIAINQVSHRSLLRQFIDLNRKLSKIFDKYCVPSHWRIDGLQDYRESIMPSLVAHAGVVHDVGGGKLPYLGTIIPKRRGQVLIGFDIDEDELKQAPKGVYDSWVVGDIGSKRLGKPKRKADVVVCQVVLEHVQDNTLSIKNMVANTKSGGTITLFVPSRNALFARINTVLPQGMKENMLFGIFPEMRHAQGFPAYYHLCASSQMTQLLEDCSCEVIARKHYYQGHYFSFFLPLHVVWRLSQAISYLFLREDSADYFCLIATKR